MPRNKDLKRIIRKRMKKTGESYTASRAHVISRAQVQQPSRTVAYAALAGMSDDKIAAKTGRTWQELKDEGGTASAAPPDHGLTEDSGRVEACGLMP